MLHGPLNPVSVFSTQGHGDDGTQYRPSKDMDAFRSQLRQPIEFVEGSSSVSLAVPEGNYQAINAPPPSPAQTPQRVEPKNGPKYNPTASTPATPIQKKNAPSAVASLHNRPIDSSWKDSWNVGVGLHNTGNTCFLNSALQCLLHTTPLLHVIEQHKCKVKSSFCMTCAFTQVADLSHGKSRKAFTPFHVSNKLNLIAKHMRKGRQEDSHEFLRYAIDAMQKSCLAGLSPKIDPKQAETTFVHKIFGGQLRSRVTCKRCSHNSDTFDSILDLSLDITHASTVRDALRTFVAVDTLKGADKYKCEKCKVPVNAEKRFSIHAAPQVLTIHLKRFSPLGRKIGHIVKYEETLSLSPYMSPPEGQQQSHTNTQNRYSLYGVICHAGGGPNSGHYFAFVKGKGGNWWEMNDESVTSLSVDGALSLKNAYVLFYQRDKGQALEAVVSGGASTSTSLSSSNIIGAPGGKKVIASMKKRKSPSDDEDLGVRTSKPFIGPQLPAKDDSPSKRQKMNGAGVDPQASTIKQKIALAGAPKKKDLVPEYDSSSDAAGEDGDGGEKMSVDVHEEGNKEDVPPVSPRALPLQSTASTSSSSTSHSNSNSHSSGSSSQTVPSTPASSIPPASFYGSSSKSDSSKKRKSFDDDNEDRKWSSNGGDTRRSSYNTSSIGRSLFTGGNPFGGSRLRSNAEVGYGRRGKGRGRSQARGF